MIIPYYTSYAIALGFISFIVGMIVNSFLKKTEIYQVALQNLNFISDDRVNKWIGLGIFRWVLLKTPLKYFNQKIKVTEMNKMSLKRLRDQMTSSEIEHLVGFDFMFLIALVQLIYRNYTFMLILLLVNVFMNLYPALLQQWNKRRLDRIISRL